jgi:outer membrane protein assembly factor BamB
LSWLIKIISNLKTLAMKSKIMLLLFCAALFGGCSKETKPDQITYEVLLLNASTWDGSYLDQEARVVSVTNGPLAWEHKFTNDKGLSVLTLQAYPNGIHPQAEAVMKIYINDKVVVEGSSFNSPQVQYIYP